MPKGKSEINVVFHWWTFNGKNLAGGKRAKGHAAIIVFPDGFKKRITTLNDRAYLFREVRCQVFSRYTKDIPNAKYTVTLSIKPIHGKPDFRNPLEGMT